MNKDKASLLDIVESMTKAIEYVGDESVSTFEDDSMTVDAVVRRIEIIGEAVKRLSNGLTAANPGIPWRLLAGMRDKVIHGYDSVNTQVVFEAVTVEYPTMLPTIQAIADGLPDPA